MSRYSRRVPQESNSKISSSSSGNFGKSQPSQSIPGTPLQQMWHILNFHEKFLDFLLFFTFLYRFPSEEFGPVFSVLRAPWVAPALAPIWSILFSPACVFGELRCL